MTKEAEDEDEGIYVVTDVGESERTRIGASLTGDPAYSYVRTRFDQVSNFL